MYPLPAFKAARGWELLASESARSIQCTHMKAGVGKGFEGTLVSACGMTRSLAQTHRLRCRLSGYDQKEKTKPPGDLSPHPERRKATAGRRSGKMGTVVAARSVVRCGKCVQVLVGNVRERVLPTPNFRCLVPEWEPHPNIRVIANSERFQADIVCCPVVNTWAQLLSSGQPPDGPATGCACEFHEGRPNQISFFSLQSMRTKGTELARCRFSREFR